MATNKENSPNYGSVHCRNRKNRNQPHFHSHPQCEIKTQMEAKTVGIKTQMTNNQTIPKPRLPTIKNPKVNHEHKLKSLTRVEANSNQNSAGEAREWRIVEEIGTGH